MVATIRELAEAIGEAEECASEERLKRLIARRLFKATACGISFWADDSKVVLTGYTEGDCGDCQPHELVFPFSEAAFWEAVEAADKDGCGLWDETHGCDGCAHLLGVEYEPGSVPIQANCLKCGGRGEVI